MANAGPNTNGSQFFLLHGEDDSLGREARGVWKRSVWNGGGQSRGGGGSQGGRTSKRVVVADCGELPLAEWPSTA